MRFLKTSRSFPSLALAIGLVITLQPLSAGQSTAGDAGCIIPTDRREQLLFTYPLAAVEYLTEAEILSLSLPPAPQPKNMTSPSPAQPVFEPWAAYRFNRPSPLAAVEKSLFTGTLIGLVGLNIADYIITKQAIKKFGDDEMSPFLRPFAKNDFALAAFKVGTTLMSVIGLRDIHVTDKPMAWALSLISNFLVSYALANNLEQLEAAGNGSAPQR